MSLPDIIAPTSMTDRSTSPPPLRARRGSITLTSDDLQSAIDAGLLTAEQAARLWDSVSDEHRTRPRFDGAHVAYYAGAVIVLSAMGWFLTEAWDSLDGLGVAAIAGAYGLAFWLAGDTLWRTGQTTPGGLLFTLAVWMVPLAVYGVERATGIGRRAIPAATAATTCG